MNKTLRIALTAVVAAGLALAPTLQAARHPGVLGPPLNVAVCGDATSVTVSWDPVAGAGKYSVEFLATYDDNGTPIEMEFDYGVGASPFTITMDSFTITGINCACPLTPLTLDVHVKALNPPTKKGNPSQNNPFSAPPINVVPGPISPCP
jgi:hypothetical protein